MSLSENTLRRGASTLAFMAVVAGVAPTANAADVHPILSGKASLGVSGGVPMALRKAVPNYLPANERAGAFVVALEEKLATPLDRPSSMSYPNPASPIQLVVHAAIPPKGFYEKAPIKICAEMNGAVVGTYNISPQGDVTPDAWAGGPTTVSAAPSTAFQFACKSYLLEYINQFKPKVVETAPAVKPSAALSPGLSNG